MALYIFSCKIHIREALARARIAAQKGMNIFMIDINIHNFFTIYRISYVLIKYGVVEKFNYDSNA